MSTLTQIDGAAIDRLQIRSAPMDQEDVLLPECFANQPPSKTVMSNKDLHLRLGEILTSCIRALPMTKLVDNYVSTKIHA